jgi:putative colanic acid biosynthesis acetyltransferase WcaF
MKLVQLARYNNSWYHPGRFLALQLAWYFLGLPLLRSSVIPSSSLRVFLLRLFGAKIGGGVVIKPGARVKYPWHLVIGNDCWLGEDCWIDNLTTVTIGSDVCLSQGAYLCTGNHDWSDPAFGLITKPITLEDGCWVGAKAVLAPGVVLEKSAIAAAGAVVYKRIPAGEIHAGNPAAFVRERRFSPVEKRKQRVSEEQLVS